MVASAAIPSRRAQPGCWTVTAKRNSSPMPDDPGVACHPDNAPRDREPDGERSRRQCDDMCRQQREHDADRRDRAKGPVVARKDRLVESICRESDPRQGEQKEWEPGGLGVLDHASAPRRYRRRPHHRQTGQVIAPDDTSQDQAQERERNERSGADWPAPGKTQRLATNSARRIVCSPLSSP